jgi:hypothetical protein
MEIMKIGGVLLLVALALWTIKSLFDWWGERQDSEKWWRRYKTKTTAWDERRGELESNHESEEGGTMGPWKTIKSLFASGAFAPADAPRLNAGNESELSVSLRALPDGERGWITLSEARYLFSHMDDQYAFGEMDDAGKSNLGAFAAQSEHCSSVDIMPVEGRVYFRRKIRA